MIALPSKLTYTQARETLVSLQKSMAAYKESTEQPAAKNSVIVVDAQALTVFDSSALAVLLDCRRWALLRECTLQVQSLPTALRGLAVLYGVSDLLPAPV